jgi:hypothetical protein
LSDTTDTTADEQPDKMFPLSYVKELRQENAGFRQRMKDAEAKADAKYSGKLRELQIAQAVTDTAVKLGADPRLTRATLAFDGLLANLSPENADFIPAIESLIQTAIEAEPKLKKEPSAPANIPTRSGSDITTNRLHGVEERHGIDRGMVAAARAKGDNDQIAKWYRSGELDAMLRGEA